ncbi:MAG: nicotinate-nucleotide adenylyltransferase [Gemmataceae bacterium]
MRLGVFGGTFDPVHVGHLILAEECRERARLDRVLFIPAARPPHKLERQRTAFHHRAEMLELAIAGHGQFRVDRMEEERSGPSFTVHTLQALKERDSAAELFLILGSDSLVDLPRWYEPVAILELATLLIVERPGVPALSAGAIRAPLALAPGFPFRLETVAMPLLEISSSDLRRRVAEGRTIRYQVPRAVEIYIREKGLYSAS